MGGVVRRGSARRVLARLPARLAVLPIRAYRYTLSALMGRSCRHWPTCSEYTEDAILRHGLWAGGWMGAARICRCGPWGTHGVDLVPDALPERSAWFKPWAYGRWRGTHTVLRCEAVPPPAP